jgi:hypothetical protein
MAKRKQITISQFITKCDSALKDEYYLEVIAIATAIIDDRIQSIHNEIFGEPTKVTRDPHDPTIYQKYLEYSSVNIGKILKRYMDSSLVTSNLSDYELKIINKLKKQSKKYIDLLINNIQFISSNANVVISYTDLVNDTLVYPYLNDFMTKTYSSIQSSIISQTSRIAVDLEGLIQLVIYKEVFIPIRNKLIHNLTDWRFINDLNNYEDLKVTAHLFNAFLRDFLALAR